MEQVVMTEHSIQRTKERTGLSKKIAEKNAEKAMEYGLCHSDCRAALKRYMDKRYLNCGKANNMRIYHRFVYVFHENKLITVLPLPRRFWALADKIQREKEDEVRLCAGR